MPEDDSRPGTRRADRPSARRAERRSRAEAAQAATIGDGRLVVRPLAEGAENAPARTLVIACGALIAELQAIARANGWGHLDVTAVPASYHNRPEKIPGAVRAKIRAARGVYDRILVAYGECGTGGLLDQVLAEEGVERIAGDHCYAFFAGLDAFSALHEAEIGTFYLTDFLALHFDSLILQGLQIDRHPGLLTDYFGNYTRIVHLVQMPNPDAAAAARRAAERLGLPLVTVMTGFGLVPDFLTPR